MSSVLAQDAEVVAKARRRSFTAEYRRGILSQAAGCKLGELGALLRREGLYSSHLTVWRREMEQRGLAGLAPRKRGPKVTPPSPEETENRRLLREVAVLTAQYTAPELMATKPNQVCSWDITKLKTFVKCQYLHLYVILDVYSRYVVGWRVETRESGELARDLMETSCERQQIQPGVLSMHSDNGPAMISQPVAPC